MEIVVDIVIALIFLGALVFMLMVSVHGANLLLMDDSAEHFDLYGHVNVAVADPWGEGFMTSMMLVSTLVPTFVHLSIGILAIALSVSRLTPWLKKKIESYDHAVLIDDPQLDQNASNFHQFYLALIVTACAFFPLIVTAVLGLGLYWLIGLFFHAPIGEGVLMMAGWVITLF